MANQNFQRSPGKNKFAYMGIDLLHPVDLMPQGRAPYLLNVTASQQQGSLRARAGVSNPINASAFDQPNVHSLVRLNNTLPGAERPWARFVGSGTKLYAGQTGSFMEAGSGFSGNPLSLVTLRSPQSPEPFLYAYDAIRQAKYNTAGTEFAIGTAAPPEPSISQSAPIVKDIAQFTTAGSWQTSGAASDLSTAERVPDGSTVTAILYDEGSIGWCSVIPSGVELEASPAIRPATLLNGWGPNAHVGSYEGGIDQGYNFGTEDADTQPYSNADGATDNNLASYATRGWLGSFRYAGVVWEFSGAETTINSYLNLLSWVPANYGTNKRSAGIWYSLDSGTTWIKIYDSPSKDYGWDSVLLPAGVALNQIQVMAFMDAHDDLVHYVYDVNISSSPHNSAYAFGARLTIGGETVTSQQIFGNLPSSTVQGVVYDGDGIATVQPSVSVPGVSHNQLVSIGGNYARILDVTEGPDGSYSFRVERAGIGQGDSITFPVSVRVYTHNAHAAGDAISSGLITAQLAPPGADSAVGIVSSPLASDLTQCEGRPLTADDYMHVSVRFSTPANVVECHVMVDVDNATNDFTGNYYYYAIRQNDFQRVSSGGQSTEESLIQAVTNQVALGYNGQSEPGQIPLGDSQYLEASFKLNDLIRIGTDSAVNLSGVRAVGLRVIVTGATTVQFGSWWVGGTYGPDANYNSSGNQGQPILYRYRYRSSTNGTISNPGPATRAGELPARNGVMVSVVASSDTQIDLIDIERNGGTLSAWHQSLTVPNTTGMVLDDVKETIAAASDPLDLLQYRPWPVTDKPRTATCNAVGTRVTALSGTPFNPNWVPGTEIIIGNKTYTLYAPPESGTVLTLAQNAGVQNGVTVRIPEATIQGNPLPYACLGPDGRVFATGDPLNPGLLYWSNPYTADTASDQGYLEITTPSEPLGPPRYYEGAIYVWSTESLYRVEPTPGQVNPYAYYKLGSAPGLASPWAVSGGSSSKMLAYRSKNGIELFGGTEAERISDELGTLFPSGGRPASAVTIAGYTVYPPDLSQAAKQRLSIVSGFIYFNYIDSQGNACTLAYSLITKGWIPYRYVNPVNLHYEEEGIGNPLTLTGHADGYIGALTATTSDRGTAFPCVVITPADDQQETRARKQYGDLILDYGLANAALPQVSVSDGLISEAVQPTGVIALAAISAKKAKVASVATTGGATVTLGPLSTSGPNIVDANGAAVQLKGVNWHGAEGTNHVPHVLWARPYRDIIDQISGMGFNCLRLPLSADLNESTQTQGINTFANADLSGLTALEVIKKIVDYAGSKGIYTFLDCHRLTAGAGTDSAISDSTLPAITSFWQLMATQFAGHPSVCGADLYNEPYTAAWGTLAGHFSTIGNAIHAVAPDWLIICEGTGVYNGVSYWWGGQLAGAATTPVSITLPNKLVYSPHDYAHSVAQQTWLKSTSNSSVANWPANLDAIWDAAWGYLVKNGTAPIIIGEYGGMFGWDSNGDVDSTQQDAAFEKQWLARLLGYMQANGINSTFWTFTSESADTGGLLEADDITPQAGKLALLSAFLSG